MTSQCQLSTTKGSPLTLSNSITVRCSVASCSANNTNICIQGSHQWLFYHSLSTLDLPPPPWLSLHTTVFKPTPDSHPHQHLNCHSTHHPCVQRHLPLPFTSFIKFLYPFLVVPSFYLNCLIISVVHHALPFFSSTGPLSNYFLSSPDHWTLKPPHMPPSLLHTVLSLLPSSWSHSQVFPPLSFYTFLPEATVTQHLTC